MATATSTKPPVKAISHHTSPLALWHLLSLDAPTVAILWTWFIASTNHAHLPLYSGFAMFVTVWMLYAADRLMDARLLDASQMHHEDLEDRHYFHHRHRTAFLTGIVLASIALAILLPHLDPAAIHLYLILGGLVCGYFILIHATRSAHRLPKEIAVGLCFAAATFIPTVGRRPELRLPLIPCALLFATLCSANCLFIYAWEHENPSSRGNQRDPQDRRINRRTHAITRLALGNLAPLTIFLALASAALALFDHHVPRIVPCATSISATFLLLLHYQRHTIARIILRAAADLALTTPLLFLPFLHL